ncbi:anti-sigma factor family protein [Rhodovulum steppense]|uniref:Putative zinc finger protein n=1 Tax=Rhodovulum steppense TaxID=540251 RepID=A0A4R1Z0P3_9RHOB|nr:zf-HC2 domain-containing protein [Rhodovulum steppense]TCM87087.1 putative zinc finger protein [Rhodovulum steppense]
MLNCKDVAARASALIDGELSGWQAMQMRLHLAMCRGCSAFVGQIRQTRDLTEAALREGTAHPGDDARLAAILARLPDQRRGV